MISDESHQMFRELVEGAQRFVLTTHMHPDGDALGSQFGLARFLLDLGKEVRIVNHDPTPDLLGFVVDDRVRLDVYESAEHDAVLALADLIILLDNSAPDRLGRMEQVMLQHANNLLCIDHHPARGAPWPRHILNDRACATAAIVYTLTRGMGWTPSPEAAESLYVGLATDTGFFRFNSTTAYAHEVASALIRIGVRPARVYRALFERNSVEYTRLLGHALADVRLDVDGAIASVRITRALIDSLDADGVDTSEILNALLAMDGTIVALLFRELDDGRIKVSLRSKGELDVHRLAIQFGGGGHRNASGIVMDGRLDDVVRLVRERTREMLVEERSGP